MYGQLIRSKYLILNMLGKGVYSKVWLAYRIDEDDFIAFKMIHEEDDATALREIDINKQFDKTSKLKIMLDSFEFTVNKEKYYCMIFPLYSGTLYDLLKNNDFNENQLQNIFKQLKSLITELHTKYKMIHGDIKPENFGYVGKNPICEDLISRFRKLGGLQKDLPLEEACKKLIDELLNDDDYNSSNFSIYNSSNEDSESDGEEETEAEETEESSFTTLSETESSISNYDSLSDLVDDIEPYKLTKEELDNLEVVLIDYSHIHSLDEDLIFEPTRYYRCIETLEGKQAGYYKDTYALACSMYELEHGDVFVDPVTENKDEEQIQLIKENFHKIEKWLDK